MRRDGESPFRTQGCQAGPKASQTAQPPTRPSQAHLGHTSMPWMLTAGSGRPKGITLSAVGRMHVFAVLMRVLTPSTKQKALFHYFLLISGVVFFCLFVLQDCFCRASCWRGAAQHPRLPPMWQPAPLDRQITKSQTQISSN